MFDDALMSKLSNMDERDQPLKAAIHRWEHITGCPVDLARLQFCAIGLELHALRFFLGLVSKIELFVLKRQSCFLRIAVLRSCLKTSKCHVGIRCLAFLCQSSCLFCAPSCTRCNRGQLLETPTEFERICANYAFSTYIFCCLNYY